ncbi:MAG: FtsX-like permease family protein [Prolixibacteraceae bacterium]|jgi:putative ABC transport system permease protein|nr:FtsX-like permease family protein [Prolixibacteraceae bacterium]MBT6007424.1 FtsX-like permease family protein [Prolixibacteraceae bacterium]MBT6835424.1 FtsX-like permease family protein [Bacteroidota bacterium]MBT6997994.1 FtsX-like permease family protein [Prolixibacteraceae bacterium]MBT7395996.1 FtsX-like permease family protein [Prolixibacteraceae bacterium]
MFKNYFKIALQNLVNNKVFTFINLAGFAIGMSCVILIALWIHDELNYDTFNENKNSIYRITTFYDKYDWEGLALTPAPLAPIAVNEMPEVIDAARIYTCPPVTMQVGDNIFYENKGILADHSILNIFSFPLIYGNKQSVLENNNSIVISQKLAFKYFDNENPVGKSIICDGEAFIIDAVLKDIPQNSHLQFDFIVPFKLMGELPWGNMSLQTYIQLNNNTNPDILEDKLTAIAKNNSSQIQQGAKFKLQPLKEIHLDAKNKHAYTITGNLNNVYLFTAIAFFILCIASFNFINLTTAKAEFRSREIGIRKIIGANKLQLKYQFFTETILLTFISLCIAVGLANIFLPIFNQLANKQLILNLFEPRVLLSLLFVSFITGILSGAYPAFYLSSFNPLFVLKNKLSTTRGKNISSISTRKILVVLQFMFSIVLVISIISINNQFKYIQQKDLEFNKEGIIYIPLKNEIGNQYGAFKNELLKQSNIKSVSAQNYLCAITNRRTTNFDWENREEGKRIDMLVSQVDYDFFRTLELDVTQGRAFSPNFSTDKKNAFIVNEAAIKAIGIEKPIGKYFSYDNKKGKIIGVVKNANLESLHKKIEPRVFHLINNFSSITSEGIALVKINSAEASKTIKDIESAYYDLCKNAPFEYHFLDQAYDNLYKSEQRTGKIIGYFTALAILISCLGLLGLTIISSKRRTKEIGIRKVNGAKVSEILTMLNKDFIKWVAIAFVVACPIAFFAMNKWLENFAYKTTLSWWIFALAGLLALGIALLTVSFQSYKAATRNPIESLRYE